MATFASSDKLKTAAKKETRENRTKPKKKSRRRSARFNCSKVARFVAMQQAGKERERVREGGSEWEWERGRGRAGAGEAILQVDVSRWLP